LGNHSDRVNTRSWRLRDRVNNRSWRLRDRPNNHGRVLILLMLLDDGRTG